MRVREARQGAVHFEHVADGHDALLGVGAIASMRVDAAKLVLRQAEKQGLSKTQVLSASADALDWSSGCEVRTQGSSRSC